MESSPVQDGIGAAAANAAAQGDSQAQLLISKVEQDASDKEEGEEDAGVEEALELPEGFGEAFMAEFGPSLRPKAETPKRSGGFKRKVVTPGSAGAASSAGDEDDQGGPIVFSPILTGASKFGHKRRRMGERRDAIQHNLDKESKDETAEINEV